MTFRQVGLTVMMSLDDVLLYVRASAADGSLVIRVDDPDQDLWALGSFAGADGLLDLLQAATSAEHYDQGGFLVRAPGVTAILNERLTVVRVSP